ncbi:MAG: hypothetical protein RLZZ385_324 [Pseudomonadota bacterium]
MTHTRITLPDHHPIRHPLLMLSALLFSLWITPAMAQVEAGQQAPDFTLPGLQPGSPSFTLSELRGRTVYLDFWASWCAPCLRSLPLYNELYHKYREQGLEIIGVNIDNPVEDGLDFLEETPLDFPTPSDPDGRIPELYGLIGMPTSYLITPDGMVKLVHVGYRNGDIEIIEEEIRKALAGNP